MSVFVATLLLSFSSPQTDPAARARTLVAQLDADRVEDRDRAEKELETLGKDALPELRRVQATATGEYAIRLKQALRRVLLGDPFEEKLLDTIKGKVPRWIYFSDAGHVAYEGGTPGASCVVLDGVAGEEFRGIERIAFSPDGRVLSYVGKTDQDVQAVVGARTFGPFSSLGCGRIGSPNPIVISPDGKRFAFHAHTGQGHFMIVDGKPEGPYDDVDHPVFSPDSARLGYAANRGGEYKESAYNVSGGKWFLVVDGKKGEEYDSVARTTDILIRGISPVFSPDSRRIAFCAGRGKTYFIVNDGKKEDDFAYILTPTFSPDSLHLIYLATHKEDWFLVRDGKHPFDWEADFLGIAFSPDGRRLAYPASFNTKKKALILDDVKGEEFDFVGWPAFSSDGLKVAYMAQSGREHFVVVDGKRGPAFDRVSPLIFDADNQATIYVATQKKKRFIQWGDRKGEEFDDIVTGDDLMEPLTRSPKSSTVSYRARMGGIFDKDERRYKGAEWYVVVGNRKFGPFDQAWAPHFSSDGKKVAFGARTGSELWWKVVDAP